jgi:hypothetical protein
MVCQVHDIIPFSDKTRLAGSLWEEGLNSGIEIFKLDAKHFEKIVSLA